MEQSHEAGIRLLLTSASAPSPTVRVFDVLYVKGRTGTSQSLVHKPLSARKAAMRQFFGEVKTRLEYAYETKGKTAEDIRTTLQRIVEER